MGAQQLNVVVFVPDSTVASMQDELSDGSVDTATRAALAAYRALDSDGNVPVEKYSGDLDDAIVKAEQYADRTDGADLVVIITDFVSDDHGQAVRTLRGSDNMFVLVECSNQPVDRTFADELDADDQGDNNVDVITVAGLADPQVAMAEVQPYLDRVAA